MDPTDHSSPGADPAPGGATFRASACLTSASSPAAPVIDRYHELVCARLDPSPIAWMLSQHLGRCWPQSVMDDSWGKVQAVADLLRWGERDHDGKLTENAVHLLDRAWGVYCQWLRFANVGRERMMGIPSADRDRPADSSDGPHRGIVEGWGGDGGRAGESVLGADGWKKDARVLTSTIWENGEGRIDGRTGMAFAGGDYYGVWDVDEYLDGIKWHGAFDCLDPIYKAFWLDDQCRIHPVKRHDVLTRNPELSPWPKPDERGWLRVRIVSGNAVRRGEEVTPLTDPMVDMDFDEDPTGKQRALIRHLMDELDIWPNHLDTKTLWRSEHFGDWLRKAVPTSDAPATTRLWMWQGADFVREIVVKHGVVTDDFRGYGGYLYDRTPGEVVRAAAVGGAQDVWPEFAVSCTVPSALLTPDRIPDPPYVVIEKDRLRGQAFGFSGAELEEFRSTAEVFVRWLWDPENEQAAAVPLEVFTSDHAVIVLDRDESGGSADVLPSEAVCVCGARWSPFGRHNVRQAFAAFEAEHGSRRRLWRRIRQRWTRERGQSGVSVDLGAERQAAFVDSWPVLHELHRVLEADEVFAEALRWQSTTGVVREGWKRTVAAADSTQWGDRKHDGTLTMDAEERLRDAYNRYIDLLRWGLPQAGNVIGIFDHGDE